LVQPIATQHPLRPRDVARGREKVPALTNLRETGDSLNSSDHVPPRYFAIPKPPSCWRRRIAEHLFSILEKTCKCPLNPLFTFNEQFITRESAKFA
jgi:hypothetical protein